MKKLIGAILLSGLLFGSFAADFNWRQDRDSLLTFNADSLSYTQAFALSRYEDFRASCGADDTSQAGFANDSVHFHWGYQTGHIVEDTNTFSDLIVPNYDTLWDTRIILDTMNVDSFAPPVLGFVGADGQLTRFFGRADTSFVTGYATQTRWFVPEWDVFVRFWAEGLAGNLVASPIVVKFWMNRRIGTNVLIR